MRGKVGVYSEKYTFGDLEGGEREKEKKRQIWTEKKKKRQGQTGREHREREREERREREKREKRGNEREKRGRPSKTSDSLNFQK